jgi:hypothetical protein
MRDVARGHKKNLKDEISKGNEEEKNCKLPTALV